jgi:hypothetical protein
MDNLLNYILQIFILFITIILLCRIIYIFIHPLFLYILYKISNNNKNINNIIEQNNINFNIKNIPIVDIEYCSIEEKFDNNIPIPIAIVVL